MDEGVEDGAYAFGPDAGVDQVEGAQGGVAAQQGGEGAGAVFEDGVPLEPEGADGGVVGEGPGQGAHPVRADPVAAEVEGVQPVPPGQRAGQGAGTVVPDGVGAEQQVPGVRGGGGHRQQPRRAGRAEALLAQVDAAVAAEGAERELLVGVDAFGRGEPREQRIEPRRVGERQLGVLDHGAAYGCRLCHHHSTGPSPVPGVHNDMKKTQDRSDSNRRPPARCVGATTSALRPCCPRSYRPPDPNSITSLTNSRPPMGTYAPCGTFHLAAPLTPRDRPRPCRPAADGGASGRSGAVRRTPRGGATSPRPGRVCPAAGWGRAG